MLEPKISIIVTIYNTESYLDKCIQSIINQSYTNIEIILVNDGSTDNSLDICRKYEQIDNRITVITSNNEGLIRARKKGIINSTGDYIAFVDSDDWIDEDMFETIVKNSCGEDIISFGLIEEYGYKRVYKRDYFECRQYLRSEIEKNIIPGMLCCGKFFKFGMLPNLVCKLIRKELIMSIINNISDNVTMGEDGDFVYNALSLAASLRIIDLCPYHYIQRNNSLVRKQTSMDCIKSLYNDLNNIFVPATCNKQWKKQINAYFIFLLLLKNIQTIVNKMDYFKANICGKRIIIYGAGNYGMSVMEVLEKDEGTDIVGIADRDWRELSGVNPKISSIEKLITEKYDVIYIEILDEDTCHSVKKNLLKLGVSEDKIEFLEYKNIENYCIDKILYKK